MSPAKKIDNNSTSKKGVQLKFKSNKDVPKTSLSPKKLGNNSSVIIFGSAFGLVFARTTHPTKPGEDAYTYDAKRMLIENPEKAATLNCINVVNRREESAANTIKIQTSGYNSQMYVFKLEDERENNATNRETLIRPFIRFLNEEVCWKFSQNFVLEKDETIGEGKTIGKLDRYMMNADIAGFLGKYVFENEPSEVAGSSEMMDEIFEASENKLAATVFIPQYWNAWSSI